MKTNRFIVALAVAAIVAPSFQSCKKGENDPFLSLRSRKARVAGEWTVASEKTDATTKNTQAGVTTQMQETTTYSDGKITQHVVMPVYSLDTTYVATGSRDITFEKEGTFTKTYVTTTEESDIVRVMNASFGYDYFTRTTVTTTTETTNGTWNFLSGVGEVKSKEILALSNNEINTNVVTKVSYTATTDDNYDYTVGNTNASETTYKETIVRADDFEQWTLSQLKNKELIGNVEIKYTEKTVDTDGDVEEDETTGTSEIVLTME